MDQDINEQIKHLESEINGLIDQLDESEGDVNFADDDSEDLTDFELDIEAGLVDTEDVKTETDENVNKIYNSDPLKLPTQMNISEGISDENVNKIYNSDPSKLPTQKNISEGISDIKDEFESLHTDINLGINKGKQMVNKI